jgi:hypothetical protein
VVARVIHGSMVGRTGVRDPRSCAASAPSTPDHVGGFLSFSAVRDAPIGLFCHASRSASAPMKPATEQLGRNAQAFLNGACSVVNVA